MKKQMDILFSNIIRNRDKWRCQYCGRVGKGREIHAAHITTRKYLTTRWEEVNCIALCATHHRYFHDHPAEFGPWLDNAFPGRRKEVQTLLNTQKVRPKDFPAIKDALQNRLLDLTGNEIQKETQ